MRVTPYKTHRVEIKEDLFALIDQYLPPLKEGDIVAVTSKVVALCQGRVVPKKEGFDKAELIRQEAEWFLETELARPEPMAITIKEGILIASAGIDVSNGQEHYVLWPENLYQTVATLWQYLRDRDALTHLGVIFTDSQTRPLRWGVTGVGLAWCGFYPLWDCRGMPDLWGRPLQNTTINVLDGLAASAVLVMGEAAEQTPLAIIQEAPYLRFSESPPTEVEIHSFIISHQEDLYAPLLGKAPWKRGGSLR
jgi:putative folate metabolism gamma-glutamate ligase